MMKRLLATSISSSNQILACFENFRARKFKRYVGVKRQTFEQMILVIQRHPTPKLKPGRPNELGVEDQVLLS